MRCVSCNNVIDVITDHPEIQGETDSMCSTCRSLAYAEWCYVDDHEHMFQDITDGLTIMIPVEN